MKGSSLAHFAESHPFLLFLEECPSRNGLGEEPDSVRRVRRREKLGDKTDGLSCLPETVALLDIMPGLIGSTPALYEHCCPIRYHNDSRKKTSIYSDGCSFCFVIDRLTHLRIGLLVSSNNPNLPPRSWVLSLGSRYKGGWHPWPCFHRECHHCHFGLVRRYLPLIPRQQ